MGTSNEHRLGQRGLAASGLSAIMAAALLTGVVPGVSLGDDLGGATPATQPVLPPPPPSLPPETGEPVLPTDGLTHLVVTPNGPTIRRTVTLDDRDAPNEPSGSMTSPVSRDDLPETDVDDFSVLDSAPDGSTIILTPDGLAIEYPDGTVVLLDGTVVANPDNDGRRNEPARPGQPDNEAGETNRKQAQERALQNLPADASIVDQLSALPGVERVIAIGGGAYSVALDDPEALDGLDLAVEDETFVALFTEPFERYQWFLENDGTTMSRFGLPATLDADIDGTAAIKRATGNGVVVAVIDTGVDFDHPDLAPNRWTNRGEICGNGVDDDANGYVDDCHGYDFVYRDGTPFNLGAHAHGTHVAGTVAAARNGLGVAGVAPDAQIMDLNVARLDGSMSGSHIAEAIRYAADNGAHVINLSLGTAPGAPAPTVLGSAIDYAASKGALVVAAAGNHGLNIDSAPVWPASYDKPNMMTVGASSPDDSRAGFSNYGRAIDIFAPGHQIASTMPVAGNDSPYSFMSGTSMATPIAAGTAALMLSQDPSATPQQIIASMRSSSDTSPGLAEFAADGRRINAAVAVGASDDRPITDLAVIVSGLTDAVADEPLRASVRLEVPTDTFEEEFGWEMMLLAREGPEVYALTDHELELNGRASSTSDAGLLDLGVSGTAELTISTALPVGDYGLLFEAVPTADRSQRLGNPFVAAFSVAAPVAPSPDPVGDQRPGDGENAPGPESPDQDPPANRSPDPTPAPDAGRALEPGPPTPEAPAPGTPTPDAPTPDAPTPGTPTPGTPAPDSPGSRTPDAPPPSEQPIAGPTPTPTTPATPPADDRPENETAGPSPERSPAERAPTSSPQPEPAPQPPTPPPAPTESGDYAVSGVTPFAGPIDTQTDLVINGRFPDPVRVFFGSIEAPFVVQTSNRITTAAPAVSRAGSVDIRLVRNGTTVLTVENGFTHRDPAGTPTPNNPTPTDPIPDRQDPDRDTPQVPPPGGSNPPAPDPKQPSPSDPPPQDQSPPEPDAPNGETDSPRPPNARQSRNTASSEPIDLGDGRSGLRLLGPNPLQTAAPCRSSPCRASRTG